VHCAWCVVRGGWCVVRGARCVVRGARAPYLDLSLLHARMRLYSAARTFLVAALFLTAVGAA
jgi:hypothetical protein